ncbi:aminotransferase class III-fold pyridoxal phosphate-dependent enzyme [Actinoplanes sp. NEAU-A12]|uniref:Aminotransferase class III-fold pyridoxal phosphate-dependent enzyme n=1 Tax=Actinoplanes sandaracinus TaxID=3045177 RepID=A0ABT6WX44_9ACTN|nr:aminotransferase class III-fold pyridoxal phosphate-dependent enzyme [Actinoplanes sandaracinus]MDI6104308.1 aminotransferase class III-fold pyridoxal phosphate-dependent enzyme [Actinoplanes sandaracinus]
MDELSGRFAESEIFVERAHGPWLISENQRWVDHVLGNCSQLLGHSHPVVVDRVQEQVARMTNVGDHKTNEAYRLARRILEISGMDSLRFVSSGSEAVHVALRTARAATGRRKVLKFAGHYHGWFAEEISRFVPQLDYAGGISPAAPGDLLIADWNDADAVRALVAEHGNELAAIICEPILCHAGPVPPVDGFLELLRSQTTASGALLIFDECITGFRLGIGGAQEWSGVKADLVTYSKALSAGFPLGVCAGTAAAMAPLAEGRAYQAATYDANSVSVAAAHAVLDVLGTEPVYERITSYGERLRGFIGETLTAHDVKAVCQGVPAVFQHFFTEAPVRNHRDALASDTVLYGFLVEELLKRGVNIYKGDLRPDPDASWLSQWFVSSAHDDESFETTTAAYPAALQAALRRRREAK